jgi:ABC-type glycerol-3-phosphate transport system substrate-binding protein
VIRLLRKYVVSITVVIVLIASLFIWNNSRGFNDTAMAKIPNYKNINDDSVLAKEDTQSKIEPSFYQYYNLHNQEGAKDTEGFDITIPSANYSSISKQDVEMKDSLGGKNGPFVALTGENAWVEYTVNVPENGYYQMGMSYYNLKGKRTAVVRSLQIDGKYPFFQAKKLTFQRMWQEKGKPWKDNQGNEFNPAREEVFGWQYKDLRDSEAKVEEPLRFYLTKGEHTIRINVIREPSAIGNLHIYSPEHLPSYNDVLKSYKEKGYQEVKGEKIKIQAEQSTLRSDSTIKRIEDREPDTEPFDPKSIMLNTFGGPGWKTGEQWAEWKIDIPKSGLYNIGMRFGQWYLNGIPVQRKLTIDGKVPFKEMEAVSFPYKPEFQIKKLGTENENYLFYLSKGEHTIRMEVQVGEIGKMLETVRLSTNKLSLLTREIIQVTGTNPDPNADWELEKNISNLVPRLHLLARDIDNVVQTLYKFGVEKGSSDISTLYQVRDTLLSMAEDTSTIPGRLGSLNNLLSSLGTWINGLSNQSLLLDYILIQSPEQSWPRPAAPWYERSGTSVTDLALSFTKDYSGIGNVYKDQKVLNVWVARGRDWVQIIKQMIDEDFTPQTGIKVNVNVVPAGQMQTLLLANTAGLAPDVALGVNGETPIDFAIRNALVNLNDFADYKDVAQRFRPGALIPYKYKNGDYALPETQNFYMLFYRKDIMQQLGITNDKIPQTWDDVMSLIPELQQNGMDFYYPHSNDANLAINEFAPFLFQNGGDLYNKSGERSALDSAKALKSIEMWTHLFTNYKLQKQADFYNRFRSGEMPIGVADYSTYILLSTAAPELTGWWGMKPIPGIKMEDGTINRSTGGLGQTGIIFKSSQMKQESWEFLKWWTSTDAQERFGSELESLLGPEARWNTANVEALTRLPWNTDDLNAILEQWNWFREREVVPGGYYSTRYIANIWNEIVLNGKLPREAVEEGVKEINKELRKKREEFGLPVSSSNEK